MKSLVHFAAALAVAIVGVGAVQAQHSDIVHLGEDSPFKVEHLRRSLEQEHRLFDFSEGPYGLDPYTSAGQFSFSYQRTDGSTAFWDFRSAYSSDEVYMFLTATDAAFFQAIFNSSRVNFLRLAPQNTRFFFCAIGNNSESIVGNMRTAFAASMDSLTPDARSYWQERLHFVPNNLLTMQGWLTDVQINRIQRDTAFFPFMAIDRHQRFREGSSVLYFLAQNPVPDLQFFALEALGFHSEYRLQQEAMREDELVITVFDDHRSDGGWGSGRNAFTTIDLPPASVLQQYNTMIAEITLHCPGYLDGNCPDWDRVIDFYVCDQADEQNCATEFARIITPYKRSGTWYSDITPMLALFNQQGGRFRFRYTDVDSWRVTVKLRLSRDNEVQGYPAQAEPLFRGGLYNAEYNSRYSPLQISVPEGTIRTELTGLVTGHGFNTEPRNCAEFCPHSHHFTVNGREYVLEHPTAGTPTGCLELIPYGVTPNQYGTWYFGRAGWCPGQDVKMFRADITSALGENNTISYRSLLDGQPFNPASIAPSDNPPSIMMTSYIVHWKDFVVSVEDNSTKAEFTCEVSPNPASETAYLRFSLAKSTTVKVELYSAIGNLVAIPANAMYTAGSHTLQMNVANLAPGVYLARISEEGGATATVKIVVAR